jgi:hypothetical protein
MALDLFYLQARDNTSCSYPDTRHEAMAYERDCQIETMFVERWTVATDIPRACRRRGRLLQWVQDRLPCEMLGPYARLKNIKQIDKTRSGALPGYGYG